MGAQFIFLCFGVGAPSFMRLREHGFFSKPKLWSACLWLRGTHVPLPFIKSRFLHICVILFTGHHLCLQPQILVFGLCGVKRKCSLPVYRAV